MSHLREPAARAERREGGRHGRPGSRAAKELPETRIRRQLLRASVLPAVAVALAGAAAVLCVVQVTGARPTPALWGVLAAAGAVAVAGIVAAVVAAERSACAVMERVAVLRRTTARGQSELRGLVERLRRGEGAPRRVPTTPPSAAHGDEFDQFAQELIRAQEAAVASVVQAAQLSSQASSEQKVELLVNLARRLQSLVHREIQLLDELENEVEDPELLKGLFHVDHLATRIRRHAENLAVLGGAISRRQWSHPVTMSEVLRSAIAEVEQYSRVKLVPPIGGTLRGHAVADVIHLLAELVENASVFSALHTQVLMRASHVTAGLAIEVEDRGLGMSADEQGEMNALLSDPDDVDVTSLISGGRIGLFVVAVLARRHGIAVRLQTNIYGGVQAVIVLPQGLLGADRTSDAYTADGRPQSGPHASAQPPRQAAAPALAAQQPQQQGQYATDGALPVAVPHQEPLPVESPARDAEPVRVPRGADAPALTLHAATHTPVAQVPSPPREHAQRDETSGSARSGPAPPLPVRAAHGTRPNPADASLRSCPDERAAPDDHGATPPAPTGVRGTTDRPQLPRRRAQEHLAPQLRDAPTTPSDSTDDGVVGHDPGLMADFQRGIVLAEGHGGPQPDHDPNRSN